MDCAFYDVPCWMGWAVEEARLFFIWCIEGVLGALLAVLAAIPVPGFLQSMASITIPDSVMFFAEFFALPEGAAMIVSAYTLRFILRRIPVIG